MSSASAPSVAVFGKRPPSVRRRILLSFLAAAGLSWLVLGLELRDLIPAKNGVANLMLFLKGAVAPALTYEAASVPEGAPPLLAKVAVSALHTLGFALGGMSLAVPLGFVLGVLGSSAWWPEPDTGGRDARWMRRWLLPVTYLSVRAFIAVLRSVHELLWAVIFLAALGLENFTAVLAIAIPYGGTLAKVFSEMIDEAPRDASTCLRSMGARPLQAFALGLLPRALPDGTAYAFYRFECAVRSSAVLGFFGLPTFGYYVRLSSENLHFREVWTYLYAMIALVLCLELWSSGLRQRMVIR